MKPKMLLFCGWGWSATSPLCYTIQRNAKYAHFGYTKVFKYLSKPRWEDDKLIYRPDSNVIRLHEQHSKGIWENHKSYTEGTHKMNIRVDLEPLDDFSIDHLSKLVEGRPTVAKYMDFYHALHDHVINKGYKSVGDAYMGRCIRKQHFRYGMRNYHESIKKYTETLKSEFDIKVLAIARDPVRRAFSNYIFNVQKKSDGRHMFQWGNQLPTQLDFSDYVDEINTIRSFFKDNFHCIVMEELWERDGATVLSEFLEHPIKKSDLWKNLYAPDIGHHVKYDKDVPCQAYGQHLLELTPEIYWHYRKKHDHIYRKWKKTYGSLPLHWGEPIEYKA